MKKTIDSIEFDSCDGEKINVAFNNRWDMYNTFGCATTKKFTPEAFSEWLANQEKFLLRCLENVRSAKKVASSCFGKSLTREQLQGILEIMAEEADIPSK